MGFITKIDLTQNCGFGSQMSQYASLFSIAKQTGLEPVFIKETLNGFYGYMLDIPFKHKPKILSLSEIDQSNTYKRPIKLEKDSLIDKTLFFLSNDKNYVIDADLGLFHYFDDMKNEIIDLFTFTDELQKFAKDFIEQVKKENAILVSISFRRGDYLQIASLNLTMNYFNEAMKVMESMLPDKKIKYVVFSGAAFGDDGWTWVKENFKAKNYVYAENMDKYQQLCLMSMCDHNIIANSSFPFWAAYLNKNSEKKIVCPFNYLNDNKWNYINGNWFPKEWNALHVY